MLRWSLLLVLACSIASPLAGQQLAPAGRMLRDELRRAFALELARRRNPPLAEAGVYHGVWLRGADLRDSTVFDQAAYVAVPHAPGGIALAYDGGLGARLQAGGGDASPLRAALRGAAARLVAQVWRERSPRPAAALTAGSSLSLRVGAEVAPRFDIDGREAPPAGTRTALGSLAFAPSLDPGWRLTIGAEGYLWRTPGVADRGGGGMTLRLARLAPPDRPQLLVEGVVGAYRRIAVEASVGSQLATLPLRASLRLGWGERLPFWRGFWLGGRSGFPGLSPSAARGDGELSVAIDGQHALWGPFDVRFRLGAGRSDFGGEGFGGSAWLVGARCGFGLTTSLGALHVEYGLATGGRGALFARVIPAGW